VTHRKGLPSEILNNTVATGPEMINKIQPTTSRNVAG